MPMTKEAAGQYLYENVQVPAFFNRLSSRWGIQPANVEEQQLMLKSAAQLAVLREAQVAQEHAAGQTLLQKAAAHIEQSLEAVYPHAFDPLPQLIQSTAKTAAESPEMVAACQALQQ
jgi:hypothetical protein